jgi:hypothetical protein
MGSDAGWHVGMRSKALRRWRAIAAWGEQSAARGNLLVALILLALVLLAGTAILVAAEIMLPARARPF